MSSASEKIDKWAKNIFGRIETPNIKCPFDDMTEQAKGLTDAIETKKDGDVIRFPKKLRGKS